jgi:hypothetical protein
MQETFNSDAPVVGQGSMRTLRISLPMHNLLQNADPGDVLPNNTSHTEATATFP